MLESSPGDCSHHTSRPTTDPTAQPSRSPTSFPSAQPSRHPSITTTPAPSIAPSPNPPSSPSAAPTRPPMQEPSGAPTRSPTFHPTTIAPTAQPLQDRMICVGVGGYCASVVVAGGIRMNFQCCDTSLVCERSTCRAPHPPSTISTTPDLTTDFEPDIPSTVPSSTSTQEPQSFSDRPFVTIDGNTDTQASRDSEDSSEATLMTLVGLSCGIIIMCLILGCVCMRYRDTQNVRDLRGQIQAAKQFDHYADMGGQMFRGPLSPHMISPHMIAGSPDHVYSEAGYLHSQAGSPRAQAIYNSQHNNVRFLPMRHEGVPVQSLHGAANGVTFQQHRSPPGHPVRFKDEEAIYGAPFTRQSNISSSDGGRAMPPGPRFTTLRPPPGFVERITENPLHQKLEPRPTLQHMVADVEDANRFDAIYFSRQETMTAEPSHRPGLLTNQPLPSLDYDTTEFFNLIADDDDGSMSNYDAGRAQSHVSEPSPRQRTTKPSRVSSM